MISNIIIIPGFGERGTEAVYKKLKKNIQSSSDISIKFYVPEWNKSVNMWVEGLTIFMVNNSISIEETIIIGFSMGAYITLISSQYNKYKAIHLCSLSPYFKENISFLPEEASAHFGKKKMLEFSYYELPTEILSESTFYFGDKDWDIAIDQACELSHKFNSSFILISGTTHELTEQYIKKISSEVINSLE